MTNPFWSYTAGVIIAALYLGLFVFLRKRGIL